MGAPGLIGLHTEDGFQVWAPAPVFSYMLYAIASYFLLAMAILRCICGNNKVGLGVGSPQGRSPG